VNIDNKIENKENENEQACVCVCGALWMDLNRKEENVCVCVN